VRRAIAGSSARPDQTEVTAHERRNLAELCPNLGEMAPDLSLCDYAPAFSSGIEALICLLVGRTRQARLIDDWLMVMHHVAERPSLRRRREICV
jgi:hypothetical protein